MAASDGAKVERPASRRCHKCFIHCKEWCDATPLTAFATPLTVLRPPLVRPRRSCASPFGGTQAAGAANSAPRDFVYFGQNRYLCGDNLCDRRLFRSFRRVAVDRRRRKIPAFLAPLHDSRRLFVRRSKALQACFRRSYRTLQHGSLGSFYRR